MRYLTLSVLFTGLFLLAGCEPKPIVSDSGKAATEPQRTVTSDDVKRDVSKASDTTTAYSKEAKAEFERNLSVQMSELDKKIDDLRAKGEKISVEAKEDWNKKMADLKVKREAMDAKLKELHESSGRAWDDMKKGAQSAWDELEKSFREASKEF